MKTYVDLHIHSKYARACSKDLTPRNIVLWCAKKGIGIVGTGDFTHPKWFHELGEVLVEKESGLYGLQNGSTDVRFLYTAEVSSIYKQGEKVRRVHNLIFAPTREAAGKLNSALRDWGVNLSSDGRPITKLQCAELVKMCKETDERIEVIPAHAWTPHFGVFGSLSGFDSLQEAYGEMAKYIFAVETGLSSDPAMNWQVQALDNISLISNSDPHSLHRLGREANCFEMEVAARSFAEVIRIIKDKNPKEFLYTVEFFPEEGRYYLDGHADCEFSCKPSQTKKFAGVCPVCGKKILRGVLARVGDLGNREQGVVPDHAVPFKNTIPLEEVIADTYNMGVVSKKVQLKYEALVGQVREFDLLFNLEGTELRQICGREIAESIERVREGAVHIQAGYDGKYGKIHIYTDEEREAMLARPKQGALF